MYNEHFKQVISYDRHASGGNNATYIEFKYDFRIFEEILEAYFRDRATLKEIADVYHNIHYDDGKNEIYKVLENAHNVRIKISFQYGPRFKGDCSGFANTLLTRVLNDLIIQLEKNSSSIKELILDDSILGYRNSISGDGLDFFESLQKINNIPLSLYHKHYYATKVDSNIVWEAILPKINIKTLCLANNFISDYAINDYLRMLPNTNVNMLFVTNLAYGVYPSHGHMNKKGIKLLAEILPRTSLKSLELTLRSRDFDNYDEIISCLASIINQNQLSHLGIYHNSVNFKFQKELIHTLLQSQLTSLAVTGNISILLPELIKALPSSQLSELSFQTNGIEGHQTEDTMSACIKLANFISYFEQLKFIKFHDGYSFTDDVLKAFIAATIKQCGKNQEDMTIETIYQQQALTKSQEDSIIDSIYQQRRFFYNARPTNIKHQSDIRRVLDRKTIKKLLPEVRDELVKAITKTVRLATPGGPSSASQIAVLGSIGRAPAVTPSTTMVDTKLMNPKA